MANFHFKSSLTRLYLPLTHNEHGVHDTFFGLGRVAIRLAQMASNPGRHVNVRRAVERRELRPFLAVQPQLPFKYLRTNYLAADLDRSAKAGILAHHYGYLAHNFVPESLGPIAAGGIVLWRGSGAAAAHEIRLKLADPIDHEGELALEYRVADTLLYVLSFSFALASLFGLQGDAVALVSRIQAATIDVPLLRKAAKDLNDVAPRHGLAAALQGLALALRHSAVVAVSHANQVTYKCAAARTLSNANYDEFYASLSASACVGRQGYFMLPLPFPEKDLSAIASTHRRRTKQKRAIRQAVTDEAARAVAALLIDQPLGAGQNSPKVSPIEGWPTVSAIRGEPASMDAT